jgi:hypothetical protein
MANNRMYLHCTCGAQWLLAKHFGAEWSLRAYKDGQIADLGSGEFEEQLQEWLDEHAWCESGSNGTHFRLEFEHQPAPTPSG